MNPILTTPITGPAAWLAADFERQTDWLHLLSTDELAEIHESVCKLTDAEITNLSFNKEAFPLPSLSTTLANGSEELENGRGFFMLRGLPVDNYNEAQLRAIYYGIGLHMGTPVGQNPRGDILGAVENVGDINDKNTRVYETNANLPFHSDPSDVVALLCLRKAKQGGLSSLISVASIYNAILSNHREYLGLFYQYYHYAHLCEDLPSLSPLFSYHEGKLSCRYLRQYIELGHEIMEAPLSTVEMEALNIFDQVAQQPDLRLDMMLEPGDIQFANNYMVLHSRTGFEDYDELTKRRKLLRLWLKMPNARTLAPDFPGRNGFPLPARD